jgi:hypothetical protein
MSDTIVVHCDRFTSRNDSERRIVEVRQRNGELMKKFLIQKYSNWKLEKRPTLTPVKGTVAPSFVTVKDRVGSLSSRMVAYLRILTASEPVFVTLAVSLRWSIELTLPEGPESSTVIPSNLLCGLPKAVVARARAIKDEKNMVIVRLSEI